MKRLAFAAMMVFGAVGTVSAASLEGNPAAGQSKADEVGCGGCHGADGNSMIGSFPKLASQHATYIAKQLADFKSGARQDPTMSGMVMTLSEQDMANLGAFYSSFSTSVGSADAEKAEAGKMIYTGGNKASGLAACMACHGPSGAGNPAAKFPSLSGQHKDYVVKALNDFRSGARTNDPAGMMGSITAKMTDADIDAVAEYIQGLH